MKASELSKILSALGDRSVVVKAYINCETGCVQYEITDCLDINKDEVILYARKFC